ncbi:MAG: precorrin-8X methylmutase [Desulfobacterales bacterium]|nr:precorrin-8X methylmutase [Desulfobacterales bacterium]
MQPSEIEALSFRIIDEEAGSHPFKDREWAVIRRMIHTSADFEYMQTTRISPRAIDAGIGALRDGRNIVTDTNMARAGIRKSEIDRFGGSVECFIDDATVAQAARESGCTRAKAAVDAAIPMMTGGIYVVGNAPTALLRLMELIRSDEAQPALVVGLPVGFVNAAESKADLAQMKVPHITNVGRKGGSNVAASVINALAIMAVA